MERKTNVVSIRVDDKIKEKISKEADSKNMTVNSLVNQIITSHVEEGTIRQDLGFTSVRKQLLKKLFNAIPKEEVIKMAETTCKGLFQRHHTLSLWQIRFRVNNQDFWNRGLILQTSHLRKLRAKTA